MLGFSKGKYKAGTEHISDLFVQAVSVITIRVECNITSGAYYNDDIVHTLHEFGIDVDTGYAINEVPKNIIYYPLNTRTISNITLTFCDQNSEKINF